MKRLVVAGALATTIFVIPMSTPVLAEERIVDIEGSKENVILVTSNEDIIVYKLRKAGYSDWSIAGIMANMKSESGINPETVQNHVPWSDAYIGKLGIGLVQWTTEGRQMNLFARANERGVPWTDINVQVDYLIEELEGGSWIRYQNVVGSLEEFKSLNDGVSATKAFMLGFERPANQSYQAIMGRASNAQQYYDYYAGKRVVTQEELDELKTPTSITVTLNSEDLAKSSLKETKELEKENEGILYVHAKEVEELSQEDYYYTLVNRNKEDIEEYNKNVDLLQKYSKYFIAGYLLYVCYQVFAFVYKKQHGHKFRLFKKKHRVKKVRGYRI